MDRDASARRVFRTLIESIVDYGIFMLDLGGRVTSWNAGAERTERFKADEIVGAHVSTFYPADDIASGKCERDLAVARTHGRFEEEGWRVRKGGERFWANVIITSMRDASGKQIGFAHVIRDLTERRRAAQQLERSEERLRLLISSVKDYA